MAVEAAAAGTATRERLEELRAEAAGERERVRAAVWDRRGEDPLLAEVRRGPGCAVNVLVLCGTALLFGSRVGGSLLDLGPAVLSTGIAVVLATPYFLVDAVRAHVRKAYPAPFLGWLTAAVVIGLGFSLLRVSRSRYVELPTEAVVGVSLHGAALAIVLAAWGVRALRAKLLLEASRVRAGIRALAEQEKKDIAEVDERIAERARTVVADRSAAERAATRAAVETSMRRLYARRQIDRAELEWALRAADVVPAPSETADR